ncbi:MAG: RsmD family RNA methyltransferase [Turneriella sp.]|nr:RsmD family RNA methyltransferase [Leptospiraceae bacterium]MCX7632664.1 RsmD family RNA methyltransferase [Turneriella sp.]
MKKVALRVGGGKYRRRAIALPKQHRQHTNATPARIKEAAFQILRNRLDISSEWIFYDLFAGSGQMGIEALSHGAAHAVFVEIIPERLSAIQQALHELDIPRSCYTLVRARAIKVLPEAFTHDLPCAIWADPPYFYGGNASEDPARVVSLFKSLQPEQGCLRPVLLMQVHEKNPVLYPEYLAANPELALYRYGSNCLLVME